MATTTAFRSSSSAGGSRASTSGEWPLVTYEIVYVDADGEQLNGSHRYELRLDWMPPVDAFWSPTMYNVPEFLLVSNPINRYSIGDGTPDLEVAPDGS